MVKISFKSNVRGLYINIDNNQDITADEKALENIPQQHFSPQALSSSS